MINQDKNTAPIINDEDFLQKEFYKKYDPDYWLYKISFLKNCHSGFAKIKEVLTEDMAEVVDDDYKRVLRTEIHFLYFQMVETLFEIIFAISKKDNRDLWLALSFSDWHDNYAEVLNLNETSDLFIRSVDTMINGNKVQISLLRWVFYFVYPSKMNEGEWKDNLEKIKDLLLIFSRDFSDRAEYNAYKHSLRFYNSSFSMSIGLAGSGQVHNIGSSPDSITYLERQMKKEGTAYKPTGNVLRTIKPFHVERDIKSCLIIHSMIKNIIETRKYSLLPELHGKDFDFSTYLGIDIQDLSIPKTGVTKSSFAV